jgi:hypothetical protein
MNYDSMSGISYDLAESATLDSNHQVIGLGIEHTLTCVRGRFETLGNKCRVKSSLQKKSPNVKLGGIPPKNMP